MNKQNGFGLVGVIIIMIITSIVSGLTTGVIMLNNAQLNMNDITTDKELKEFIEVYEVLLSKYYDNIDKSAMLKAAEDGMLNFLGDKYTTYLNDGEYQEILDELSSSFMGIGIDIENNTIINVLNDSPAFKAGIQVGDYISKINGIDIEGKNTDEISLLIKGDKSDSVTLELKRGNDILIVTLKKEKLENKTISYKVIENTNIGYIYVKNFSENLDEQMENALKSLEKEQINSLIIDLRDNVGGYLQAAEKTASLFLEEGKKIYSLQNNNSEVHYKDKTKEKREYPIVVLINNNSASAAEILAAALKESYGATLVGVKSYGKGKVQEVTRLENGDSVKTTSAKWLTPNGSCIDGIGIMPDYTEAYMQTGIYNDTQLEKAINVISTLN